jgi:hypothetical protein
MIAIIPIVILAAVVYVYMYNQNAKVQRENAEIRRRLKL